MRLRNNPNALFELSQSDYVLKVSSDQKLNLNLVFKNNNPIHLEIGAGKGQFITKQAKNNPSINYIAIEKYPTVAAIFLKKLLSLEKLNNLKILVIDASLIDNVFEKNAISKIYLNFSDPWPKKRHETRRLTNIGFLQKYWVILKNKSTIELKTDNDSFYLYSLSHLIEHNIRIIYNTSDLYSDTLLLLRNVSTEYEDKFKRLGKNINQIEFEM